MSLPGTAVDGIGPLLPELDGFGRPRLRPEVPILWRGTSSIQLGDDIVLDRVSRVHVSWLCSLDGLLPPERIEQALPLPVSEARRLLRGLRAAGGLEDAARIPGSLRWCPQPERDAAVRRFATALSTYRDLDAAFAAMDGRERTGVFVLGDGDLATRVRQALADAGLSIATEQHAALAILADGAHPDVPAHFDHDLQDLPHLPVGVLGSRASVGPLVVPGRTGCLRCAHLHRRDADPAWPLLAVQWAQAVRSMALPPVDPLLARLAADHAALAARTWADAPDRPALWADHALEFRLPDLHARRVSRRPHPLCGCRWAAA